VIAVFGVIAAVLQPNSVNGPVFEAWMPSV
jgi:hypothetical protein